MKVILAEHLGMCFGVRDALKRAAEAPSPGETTIHGELVHNEVVSRQLAERGFRQTPEENRSGLPSTPLVLITAHGISDKRRLELLESGKELIDTTCPLVRRVHEAAQSLERDGFYVLVLGKPGHVEVQGVIEDLRQAEVIGGPQDVRRWPHSRLGIVCQTTVAPQTAADLCRQIRGKNPHAQVRFADTICEPTRRRQQAMEALLDRVPAVVVVGGRNSNNTLQLVALCRQRQVAVMHVTRAAELDAEWLAPFDTVGLTAGTSTLDETVAEVYAVLVNA